MGSRISVVLRPLLTLASAVSLLLCIATGALWVRSYSSWDSVDSPPWKGRSYGAASVRGVVRLYTIHWLISLPDAEWRRTSRLTSGSISPGVGAFWDAEKAPYGLRTGRWVITVGDSTNPVAEERFIVISDWLLVVILGALPVVWFRHWRRSRRDRRLGCCHFCGYNLTGNTSRVCPECGTPVQQKHWVPT